MYESFFGFQEKPFTLLPDPSFLYLGKKHSTAFSMLEYGLHSQAGFTVITGEVGSGKTTLIRHLLNQVEDDITVGLVSSSHHNMGLLLKWVLMAFDQDYDQTERVALFETFSKFLITQYAEKKRTVLIIDEAQNLEPELLEELRLLSNINADKDLVLQIILVGQPELRDLLNRPELLQFKQRISVDYFLASLNEQETEEYITHRVQKAGSDKTLFSTDACMLIHHASKGVPRVINTICDTVLVYAFAEQQQDITIDLIWSVLKDKASSGLFDLGDLDILTSSSEPEPVMINEKHVKSENRAKDVGKLLFRKFRDKA